MDNKKGQGVSLGLFYFNLAEREGFEPSIGFWPIHTFQACSFNRSDTSPFTRYIQPSGPATARAAEYTRSAMVAIQ